MALHLRMLKRPSSKAAASEEARRTLQYVEPLSDARTPLEDFFSILLRGSSRRSWSNAVLTTASANKLFPQSSSYVTSP